MADDKKLSPLEALERGHVAAAAARRDTIAAAYKDLREAEKMVRDAKKKINGLQQENITASFAYDAARADLLKPKAA